MAVSIVLQKIIRTIKLKSDSAGAFFIVMVLLLQSCGSENPPLYSSYHTLDPGGWDDESVLEFDPMPADSVMPAVVDVAVGLRHDRAFPFRKLWLKIDRFGEDSEALSDTIAIDLADNKGGWIGKGHYGLYEINDTIWHGIYSKEISHVEIRHIMEDKSLPGVYNLGLIVSRPINTR